MNDVELDDFVGFYPTYAFTPATHSLPLRIYPRYAFTPSAWGEIGGGNTCPN